MLNKLNAGYKVIFNFHQGIVKTENDSVWETNLVTNFKLGKIDN